jgi:ABC-2 type transport system permease protein
MNAQERYASLREQPFRTIGVYSSSLKATIESLRNIVSHREMLGLLVRRDLKSRYKDSTLGFVWTLIKPLTQLLIYYVVIGRFLGAARGIPDFAIYVFTGLTVYSLFTEIISGSTASIVGNSGLIKKIYLPREVFPLASVGGAIFNFVIQLGILIIASIALGSFHWSIYLLYAIPAFLLILIYGTALGLLLSAVNVYLRDIQYLVEVVLLVLLWGSPVVYSWQMAKAVLGPVAIEFYTNNPITLGVLGFQRAFWSGGQDSALYPDLLWLRILIAGVIGLVLLILSQRVFSRLQGNFAQEL